MAVIPLHNYHGWLSMNQLSYLMPLHIINNSRCLVAAVLAKNYNRLLCNTEKQKQTLQKKSSEEMSWRKR